MLRRFRLERWHIRLILFLQCALQLVHVLRSISALEIFLHVLAGFVRGERGALRLDRVLAVDAVLAERRIGIVSFCHNPRTQLAGIVVERLRLQFVLVGRIQIFDIVVVLLFDLVIELLLNFDRPDCQTARRLASNIRIRFAILAHRIDVKIVRQLVIVVQVVPYDAIAVLVQHVGGFDRRSRFDVTGGVGVQRLHLLRQHRHRALLSRDVGKQDRVARQFDLAGAVDAAQHLHEDVDVLRRLHHDHVARLLVGELLRSVQADSLRTSHVHNQCIQATIVESPRAVYPVLPLFDRNLRELRIFWVTVIHRQFAARNLGHAITGLHELRPNPVNRGNRQIHIQLVDYLLRLIVGGASLRVEFLQGDVDLVLIAELIRDADVAGPLQGAGQYSAIVEVS